MVHQDLAHQLRRYRKEMLPVLKLPSAVRQAQVCFVYHSGALESVSGALALQAMVRDASKLRVDKGHQRVERSPIAFPPFSQ
jgi:hypothetical protein